ncbi:MAG: class I SAM-dependent methyltransferase, partial [Deltaproteobacteria bacterium]|nr:class I SAM-dependent methyltransferase [Deltaproteobacteria bacterium]
MTSRTVDQTVDARVKDLYMRYPYPSAEVDTGVALFGLLDYVRYVLWPGRASLDGLRILDAGCGTGQVAVQIARDYPHVRVVGIDISSASLEVARQRARAAGITDGERLSFRQASIEELAPDEQPFDYVISWGVLHHLSDPVAGARQLTRLLAPTGGIGMMVYAPHGRHGVYVLQEALRRLMGERDLSEQVVVA